MDKKEYIERGALIASLAKLESEYEYADCSDLYPFVYGTLTGVRQSKTRVMAAPSSDVVEVVRCKDCKHYDTYFRKCYLFCTHEYHTELDVEDDHFCSHGERREDG